MKRYIGWAVDPNNADSVLNCGEFATPEAAAKNIADRGLTLAEVETVYRPDEWEMRPVLGMKCIVIAEKGMMHGHAHVTTATAEPEGLTATEYERAALIASAPQLLAAARALVRSFQTGEHYNTQNPYTRPEVKAALEAIKAATNFPGDWMDANTELVDPYERRVRELEAEGLTRSDAQGVADAEVLEGKL